MNKKNVFATPIYNHCGQWITLKKERSKHIPITPWIPALKNVKDGDEVSAGIVNPILEQYTQRTQHLFEKFNEVGDKSVLIAYGLPIRPTTNPADVVGVNDIVYYSKSEGLEGLALARVSFLVDPINQSGFTPASSAYTFGVVKEINAESNTANVYILGLIDSAVDIDDPTLGFIQSDEIDQSADFLPGPFFLSKEESGKLTRNPGGLAVFVGYALSRRRFLLVPNVNELNQFFTSYKFNILDRPAGMPVLTGGNWSVTNPDLNRVGWVNVGSIPLAIQAFAPIGATFFYNLPGSTHIDADSGISLSDRAEQKELALTLPPVPTHLTTLTVNGIAQPARDAQEPEGIYAVNELGLWWCTTADGYQPWSSDIPLTVAVVADSDTDELARVDGAPHGFEIGDVLRFDTTTTLPDPLVVGQDYVVSALNIDGIHFKVATSLATTSLDITTTPAGLHTIYQPYIWKSNKAVNDGARPRMSLQFIKFNPNIRDSLVTSVKKYNSRSNALSFWVSDKSVESVTGHGDLLARLQLNYADSAATTAATAVTRLAYTETTGVTTVTNIPVVSSVIGGDGITVAPVMSAGVAVPGSYLVSATTAGSFGRVTSLEPDGAELLYTGLHSYVSLITDIPSSVIGKITLTNSVPTADMSFVAWIIGLESLSVDKTVSFDFSYAVSRPGSLVDNTVVTIPITFTMPAGYTAKKVLKLGGDGIPFAARIPADAFGPDCSVNFKLARKTGSTLTTPIGLVDIYWTIG